MSTFLLLLPGYTEIEIFGNSFSEAFDPATETFEDRKLTKLQLRKFCSSVSHSSKAACTAWEQKVSGWAGDDATRPEN